MLIRKKHKEYCNKLKLQKKGAKQYRAMELAKNLGLLSKKAEKYKRKKNYFRNGKKNTVEIRVKMWIHALKHLKRKHRKVHIMHLGFIDDVTIN